MLEDSRSLLMEVVSGRREELGPRNPLTLHSISTLSQVLQEQGRAAEAEPLAREALATSTELLGSKHPDTLGFGADLARCLVELGCAVVIAFQADPR